MRKVIASIKPAIFPVYSKEEIIGTCFICKSKHVITCAHVVENSEEPIVEINGKKVKLIPVFKDRSWDVAICELSDDVFDYNFGLELGAYDDAAEGDDALMCGFPLGLGYHVTHKGMISAKDIINGRYSFQIDASINRGNSGGPCIILKDGNPIVVGVIATRLVDIDFTQLQDLANAFKENGQRSSEKTTGKEITGSIARLMLTLTDHVGITLNQFNRYLNVGFGEAVSIDYVTHAINNIKRR
ncbi:MAG: trypsin-like peptidase domain-containing protein [Burkholderiales bacterium]|nr:trypsin-like peptidase domain-containing protein [Burkholderiales bacterium]